MNRYPWKGGKQRLPESEIHFFEKLYAWKSFERLYGGKGPVWSPHNFEGEPSDWYNNRTWNVKFVKEFENSGFVESKDVSNGQTIYNLIDTDFLVGVVNDPKNGLHFWKKKKF